MRKPEIYEFEFQSSLCVLASLLTNQQFLEERATTPEKKIRN